MLCGSGYSGPEMSSSRNCWKNGERGNKSPDGLLFLLIGRERAVYVYEQHFQSIDLYRYTA
ncbi:hypothetical protein PAENIP36_65360 [Paenibacillus sp. P36]